ncbi:MAG: hypothetical protein AB7G23_02960 [Vicinamibacterales bacterium]
MPAIPKPEPSARVKRREQREEAAISARVRAECVKRDGHCRAKHLGGCAGPSEWAHAPWWTRAKTRGMAPERRHTTADTLMLCRRHHARLDGRERPRLLIIRAYAGCDGALVWSEGE